MEITKTLWKELSFHIQEPLFSAKEKCIYQLPKIARNLIYKGFLGVAMAVALLATPLLFFIDCIGPKNHVWTRMKIPTLIEFYSGQRNDQGVAIEEIWRWDDRRLEEEHNFIQWLFPIEAIGVNPTAPPTSAATIEAFQKDKALQAKMLKSLGTMLAFYGFARTENGKKIDYSPSFPKKKENWLKSGNHNYRRISRILKSLCLHGLKSEAEVFFTFLQKLYGDYPQHIGTTAFQHWQEALQ